MAHSQEYQVPHGLAGAKVTLHPYMEYLNSLDQLLIKQQVELIEAITDFETQNRYQITNSMGQQVMFVMEESDCCARQCCGANRSFTLHVTDNKNEEVMRMTRECSCMCCCLVYCSQACGTTVTVESPPGNIIGFVKQEGYIFKAKVGMYDDTDNRIGIVQAPLCPCTCCCCPKDIDLPIRSEQGNLMMGNIAKTWAGCGKEAFTDADNFTVSFPMSLDTRSKLLMFASAFLMDFLIFEGENDES